MSTSVACAANKWTLVAQNYRQGRIRPTLTNPTKYVYDVVPTGDPTPSDTLNSSTRILPYDIVWDFQYREKKDIYIYAHDHAGTIDFDDDAPYTDIYIQDQMTQAVILNFNEVQNSTTLAVAAARNTYVIQVVSATGFAVGRYVILFNATTKRFMFAFATAVVGTTITLDTHLDADMPAGTNVDVAIIDMSVNATMAAPRIFGLRGTGAPPGVDLDFDVTRILFTCIASDPVSLSLFGDLPRLANGLMLRRRNSVWYNIFNIKDNRELAGIMFDFTVSQATNPAQGENGFVARLTFSGQDKIGVVQRLPVGDDLEFMIQDNLSGLLSFTVIAEGHIVE